MALTTNITAGQANHAGLHNEERTAINTLGADVPRRIGTGAPGGSAPTSTDPVGTEYIDTTRTLGAFCWQKLYSGAGTDKWIVTVGDTGWRDVSADLLNGWTGTLLIKRTETALQVSASLTIPATPSDPYYSPPAGFHALDAAINGSVPALRWGPTTDGVAIGAAWFENGSGWAFPRRSANFVAGTTVRFRAWLQANGSASRWPSGPLPGSQAANGGQFG